MTAAITRGGVHARAALVLGSMCAGFLAGMAFHFDLGRWMQAPGTMSLLLLCLALSAAFGFELVNGFHDTANAAATVIYTHSLPPALAAVWSGIWNFLGAAASSGAVAFAVVALLPVDLILQAGAGSGFAMVFALLLAATSWNLATWYMGLPVSSSHALIGAILGVGLIHSLILGAGIGGVDWSQALAVGWSLLISPLIGFIGAALLLATLRKLHSNPALFSASGGAPPPLWIRGLLILTCGGVSFAHGSNDGQKGMGLIMLILIGLLPTTYATDQSAGPHFVPLWVKLGVALALGVGTMFGWRRVAVTVGERIGKSHLTYAQGAAAELMAIATIFGADSSGMPVSTTHVLTSGIAGAMVASGSGLHWNTIRKLATAWLLTLPAAMSLSATLYLLFRSWS